MKISVLCPSEIAIRRFMPSLSEVSGIEFVGVGVNSPVERFGDVLPDKKTIGDMLQDERQKAAAFINTYGGKRFDSYEEVILSSDTEAVYIPLPPALHYKWAKAALDHGKHVLAEKPATVCFVDTEKLIIAAERNKLALHENYMFIFHNQLNAIEEIIHNGEIGDVRLYRISFGFPRRAINDFRYNKALGGGALIDAGGYTIKYATRLLGGDVRIKDARLNYVDGFDVDIFGSGTLENTSGVAAQIAFGMDNDYKCELEVWGSQGTLRTGRVLTAPSGFVPTVTIKKNTTEETRDLPADDAFQKSIQHFLNCIDDVTTREENYETIRKQAQLVERFRELADQ